MKNEKKYFGWLGWVACGIAIVFALAGGCGYRGNGEGIGDAAESIRSAEKQQRQTESHINQARRAVEECRAIIDDNERRINECQLILRGIQERATSQVESGKVAN